MAFIEVNGLHMYYAEHGVAAAPVLVLLHGFADNGTDDWAPQIAVFAARYRLLVPDLRGHGRTANPDGNAAMNHRQFARDIIAFCRALEVPQAAFCGHSSGAMLLLTLALEAPDLARACILEGGTYYYSAEVRAWLAQQTPDTLFDNEAEQGVLQTRHAALGPDHWRTVLTQWTALSGHAHAEDFPEEAALRAIRTPMLVLNGDRDFFFPVEIQVQLYRLLPEAELCLLPNSGHDPAGDHPDWFNAIVLDFLARRYTLDR